MDSTRPFFRGSTGLHIKPPNEKMAWKTSTQLAGIPQLRLEITKKKHTAHTRHIYIYNFLP